MLNSRQHAAPVQGVFVQSTWTVTQQGSAAMPVRRAWPTIWFLPEMPTATCRDASLRPVLGQAISAHSAASLYHTSPMALRRPPPEGFANGRRRALWRRGGGGALDNWTHEEHSRSCLFDRGGGGLVVLTTKSTGSTSTRTTMKPKPQNRKRNDQQPHNHRQAQGAKSRQDHITVTNIHKQT
jgi:hypothetical protein